jgi:hypothetical protein
MPFIERTIFQYTLRDVCLKEIIEFENKREISSLVRQHPKNSMNEAKAVLKCFTNK